MPRLGAGHKSPRLRGRAWPHPLPKDLRLLQPVCLRQGQEVPEAAGDDDSRHGLPDAFREVCLPRLRGDLRHTAFQPRAQNAARARRPSHGRGPDLHRPHQAPGVGLRDRAAVLERHAACLLPQRQVQDHREAHLPWRRRLPKAPDRAAPRHPADARGRVDRHPVGHRVPQHRDLHRGRGGVYLAHRGLQDRRGWQRRRLSRHDKLPRPGGGVPGYFRGLPVCVHHWRVCERAAVPQHHPAVSEGGQPWAPGLRALLAPRAHDLPPGPHHRVVRAHPHVGGIRCLAARVPGPAECHRGRCRSGRPELLRREDRHLRGDAVAVAPPHRGLHCLLRPVLAAPPLLQRAPEDGRGDVHCPASPRQYQALSGDLRDTLRCARTRSALDPGAVPSSLGHHE
mmetsp:Transcript_20816/g.65059  ORF Transcript_20816/g.65059 Transcript_20816/m.65059 type:complete len:396 (+) Transcript_20816:617-1804(+)